MAATTREHRTPAEWRSRLAQVRTTRQLLELQDLIRRQAEDMADDVDSATGSLSADAQETLDALLEILGSVSQRARLRAAIDDIERRTAGVPLDNAARDWQRRCCEFSLFRAAAHAIGLHGVDAAREIEVQQELVRRSEARAFTGNVVMPIEALSVQVRHLAAHRLARFETRDVIGTNTPAAGPGGSLIGTYTDPQQYIDVLRPSMAVRQAGARVLTGLGPNLRLPRMTRSGVPGWFAENTAIPTTDETFDDVTLTPHHDGAIVTVTRNALQQAQPDVESIVRAELAMKLANDVDVSALAGTGVAPQPLGIVTDPLVPTIPAAALSYDGIVDLIGSLASKNALNGSLGFVGDAAVMVASMKLKDTMERPLGDLLWHGYPAFWSNLAALPAAPTDPLVFGNWADLIIGFWSELDVLVNPYSDSAFSKGNVQIRAAMTLDIAKRHPESFVWMDAGGGAAAASAKAAPALAKAK